MTVESFGEQVDRLIRSYSSKNYPDERVKVLYDCFKHIGIEEFRATITSLIGSHRHAPMAKEITEEISLLKKQSGDHYYRPPLFLNKKKCLWCSGLGRILATKIDTQVDYLYRCGCLDGQRFSEHHFKWHEGLLNEYKPDYLKRSELPTTEVQQHKDEDRGPVLLEQDGSSGLSAFTVAQGTRKVVRHTVPVERIPYRR